MKTNKINIQEENCELVKSKNLIVSLLDGQINNYQLQFLIDWERNHSTSTKEKDEKIKALKAKKEEILNLFNSCDISDPLVDVKINIDIAIKDKERIAV